MTSSWKLWHERGRQLQLGHQLEEAALAYRQALSHEPDNLKTLNNLGALKRRQGNYMQALSYLNKGLQAVAKISKTSGGLDKERHPELVADWSRLLNSYCQLALDLGWDEQARSSATTALLLNPTSVSAINLGVSLDALGRDSAAERCHQLGLQRYELNVGLSNQLVGVCSTDAEKTAQMHRELCNLATSRLRQQPLLKENWRLLLARLGTSPDTWTQPTQPWERLWTGQDVNSLLLWDEQGFGDALQCLRWVHAACDHAQRVTLLMRPSLLRIVKERLPLPRHCHVAALPEKGPPLEVHERHCPLMGLPAALNPLDRFVHTGLVPGVSQLVNQQRTKKSVTNPSPRQTKQIGLVWEAGSKVDAEANRAARQRSLPAALLMRHALRWRQAWSVELLSLQLGEAQHAMDPWIRQGLIRQLSGGGDWEDTARVVGELDLVISVDTAIVHLAGNLATPCIVLLNANHDWRWGREDAPVHWYNEQRVLRCRKQNSWDSLLQQADSTISALLHR